MSTLISIAGESGVGKSSIAKIISLLFKESVILSTDDLHRWPRGHAAWKYLTHLDPAANDLDLGDEHIKLLLQGCSIERSEYCHKLGGHKHKKVINPKMVIINEGLHAYYTDYLKSVSRLKIYIEVEDSLKSHWKIIRDITKRSYTKQEVIDSIERRKPDSKKIENSQKPFADIIVSISPMTPIKCIGDANETITTITNITCFGEKDSIQSIISRELDFILQDLEKFLETSNIISLYKNLNTFKGGNLSIKTSSELMFIKSSGKSFSQAKFLNGFNVVDLNILNKKVESDSELSDLLLSSMVLNSEIPSMETMMHTHIPYKYVLHLHPKYVNALLCMEESGKIIKSIFDGILDYRIVDYKTPGLELSNEISKDPNHKVIFLLNHGVIFSSEDYTELHRLLYSVQLHCKEYLNKINIFDMFEEYKSTNVYYPFTVTDYYYPDASILKMYNIEDNFFIDYCSKVIGTPRPLSSIELKKLESLGAEKIRQCV